MGKTYSTSAQWIKLRELTHPDSLKIKTASEIPQYSATAYIRPENQANRIFLKGGLGEIMKRWFGVFSVLFMLFSLTACAGQYVRRTEQPEQVIEEFNQGLPRRVDPVTTLEKVTRNGSALTYHYVVDIEASEIPKKQWQRTLDERTEGACDNQNKKYFNVVFGVFDCIFYDYRDKDGEMLALGKVDKNTCNGVNN